MGKDKKHEASEVVPGLDDFIKHISESQFGKIIS